MAEIKVYAADSDDFVPVTQDWCDTTYRAASLLFLQREVINLVSSLRPKPVTGDTDAEKLRKLSRYLHTELDLMSDVVREAIRKDREARGSDA